MTNSCSYDGAIKLGPLGSDAMCKVFEISDACFVHILLQYTRQSTGFKCGEFGGRETTIGVSIHGDRLIQKVTSGEDKFTR